MRLVLLSLVVGLAPVSWALGQSSSLFLSSQARKAIQAATTTRPAENGSLRADAGTTTPQVAGRNMAVAMTSLTAIVLPEPRVYKVNDLIGVIVRHRLRYQSDAKVKQDSEWEVKAKLDAWFRLHNNKWEQQNLAGGKPQIDFKSENELENQGKSDRKDVFETRLMGKIIDIKPNGNMIIVAWARVQLDDDDQYIRLSGECSKQDISADGSVLSDKIFGLDVRTMNEGTVRDAVKRGWLKEMVDFVKPF